jgi:hypothetical protein
MHPLKRTARTAGLLYLMVVLLGPFVLIYVPNKLFVPGDAQLFNGVNRTLATVMVITILIDAPLAFLSVANEVATLAMAKGAGFLSALDKPQRDTIAALLLNVDRESIYLSELFWGLWLLPLAVLIHRSGFVPRWLGVWIGLNGVAYVALSFIGLLVPTQYDGAFRLAMPFILGEVALTVWLLTIGVRARDGEHVPWGQQQTALS